jgi:hypothetical protein
MSVFGGFIYNTDISKPSVTVLHAPLFRHADDDLLDRAGIGVH